MTMYDVMYESICEQLEDGQITIEEAELLNEAAYDRYVIETSRATKAKRDELYYSQFNDGKSEARNTSSQNMGHDYHMPRKWIYGKLPDGRSVTKGSRNSGRIVPNGYDVRSSDAGGKRDHNAVWDYDNKRRSKSLHKYKDLDGNTHIIYRPKGNSTEKLDKFANKYRITPGKGNDEGGYRLVKRKNPTVDSIY